MLLTHFSGMWKVPTAKILAEDSWVLGPSCRPWAGTAQSSKTIYLFLFQQALTQGQLLVYFWPCTQPSSSSVFLQGSPLRGGAALSLSGLYGHLGIVIPVVFFKTLYLCREGWSRVDLESPCPVENPPASPPDPTHNLNLSFPSAVYGIK